jgi:hypothetical protein
MSAYYYSRKIQDVNIKGFKVEIWIYREDMQLGLICTDNNSIQH